VTGKTQTQKKASEPTIKDRISVIPIESILNLRNIGIALLFLATLYLISPPLKLPWITLKEGDYPKESVLAEIDFEAADLEATRLAQEQAAAQVPPVYVLTPELVDHSVGEAKAQFQKIEQDALNALFTHEERIALLSKYMPGSISQETLDFLAGITQEELDPLRSMSLETTGEILKKGVLSDVPGSAKQISIYDKSSREWRVVEVDSVLTQKTAPDRLKEMASNKFPDKPSYQRAFKELSSSFIKNTLSYDEKLTRDAQDDARNKTPVVTDTFSKNKEIVQAGHKVTAQDMAELSAHAKALSKSNRFQVYAGNAMVLLMVFGWFLLYLQRFRPEIFNKNKPLLLVGILVLITLLTGRLFMLLPLPDVFLYLVPVAAGAILLSILVDDRAALVYSFFISVLYAAQGGYRVSFFLIAVFGSLAGIFYMRRIRRRSDIFWPGIVVAFVNIATILALNFIGGISEELPPTLLAGFCSGLITAIGIVPGSLIPLEWLLGIVTNISLLELSDLNHPLLKRLAMHAPGTYHHSLMVGNMAEAAAEQIGANSLLARVGSYYHDVGKTNKPLYFSENQGSGKNKHDDLAPTMSALVLIAHVKEGVELAREYRLNEPIIEFIRQHHGTSLMPFFYQKAIEQKSTSAVEEENFRYLGPKPQSRETAICMLADSVEAASRTLSNPTHGRIKSLVEKIVNNKFIDSELDECDLTLKDIHMIVESFVRVLAGYLHSRVEYPAEQTVPEIKEKFESPDTKVRAKTGNKARINTGGN